MDAGISELAGYSPQIALARAKGVQFAPYLLNCRATFTDTTTTTLNPSSLEGGQGAINQPSIIDRITYEIDAPNSFAGNVFKPEHDFFYQRQSGISATLAVQGAPRYTISPYFTPLSTLLASLSEGWPCGWVLNYNQTIVMQFQQSIPVESTPTSVIVTFRMWQPVGTDEFQMMTATDARNQLQAAGLLTPPAPLAPTNPVM
jgi:hypothetical protein